MPIVLLWNNGSQKLTLPIWRSESLDYSADPSEHPVERGTPIADHVEVKNAKGSFEVVISNTPIRANEYGGTLQTVDVKTLQLARINRRYEVKVPRHIATPGPFEVGALSGFLLPKNQDFYVDGVETRDAERIVKLGVLAWDIEFDLCQDVLGTLRKLQMDRTLVEVAFSFQTIVDAVLTKITPVRNTDLGSKALTISVSYEQLRFGTAERVATPLPTEPRGQSKTGKGSQGAKAPKDGPESALSKTLAVAKAKYKQATGEQE
jgi:hypothetical protein